MLNSNETVYYIKFNNTVIITVQFTMLLIAHYSRRRQSHEKGV